MCAAVSKGSPYLYKCYSGGVTNGKHRKHISFNSFCLGWLADVLRLFVHSAVNAASLSCVLSAWISS